MDQPWWGSREKLALSISEAAQICGVRRRTIRRRHQAGEFEHAFKEPDGSWRIPVDDLVAAGLRPNVVTDPEEPRIVFSAASQVDRLRVEVAVLRERVRALEVIARERGERVTDLRTILRMLPGARGVEESAAPPVEEEPSLEAEEEPLVEAREEPPVEVEDEFLADQDVIPEEVEAAVATGSPSRSEQTPPPFGPSSPFDAPEPIVILPDVPDREPEPSEGSLDRSAELLESARRRSTELIEDAMSLWWPSPAPAARGRSEDSSVSSASVKTEQAERGDMATRMHQPSSDSTGAEGAESPSASPPPMADTGSSRSEQPGPSEKSDLFTRTSSDEAALDWLYPDFDRPPRHLRRRLGRFFRRHRRPR